MAVFCLLLSTVRSSDVLAFPSPMYGADLLKLGKRSPESQALRCVSGYGLHSKGLHLYYPECSLPGESAALLGEWLLLVCSSDFNHSGAGEVHVLTFTRASSALCWTSPGGDSGAEASVGSPLGSAGTGSGPAVGGSELSDSLPSAMLFLEEPVNHCFMDRRLVWESVASLPRLCESFRGFLHPRSQRSHALQERNE